MGDIVYVLNALGLTPVLLGVVIGFGAMALFFGFTKKS